MEVEPSQNRLVKCALKHGIVEAIYAAVGFPASAIQSIRGGNRREYSRENAILRLCNLAGLTLAIQDWKYTLVSASLNIIQPTYFGISCLYCAGEG